MSSIETWGPGVRSWHKARPIRLCAYFQIGHDIGEKQEQRYSILAKGGERLNGPLLFYSKRQSQATLAENAALPSSTVIVYFD